MVTLSRSLACPRTTDYVRFIQYVKSDFALQILIVILKTNESNSKKCNRCSQEMGLVNNIKIFGIL
jgi:hypothetical protein